MFSSLSCSQQPGRSRFLFSPRASLYSVKALPLLSLALFALFSLAPRPAQAQALPIGWTAEPCDANGNTSGVTGFQGTQTGTLNRTGTYKDINDFITANPNYYYDGNYENAASFYINPTYLNADAGATVEVGAIGVESNSDYGSQEGMQARNFDYDNSNSDGFFTAPGYNDEALSGSLATDVSAGLTAYFKCTWQGSGPQPAYPASMSLLVTTTVTTTGSVSYGRAGETSGLMATANASDSLGDTLSASVMSPGDTSPPPLVTSYIVQAPIDSGTGIVSTGFSGQAQMTVKNTVPYTDAPGGRGTYTDYSIANAKATISAIAAPTSASLQAHSTVDTSAAGNLWDPTKPRFFSGTNCSAIGTAVAASGYVREAHLEVGGTDVKDYYDTSFVGPTQQGAVIGTNQTSASLTVHFDSTYFKNGTQIPVQMSVTDTAGNKYPVNITGPACNNLLAVANQTTSWDDNQFNPPVNVAEEAVNGTVTTSQPIAGVVQQSGPNNISGVAKDSDHKSDLIADIAGSNWTVFFIATHSAHGKLGDCYSTPDSDNTAYLADADIQGAIATRTKALYPPYLFVHIHGCEGGGTTTLANDFGIASVSSDDRACVAYDQSISTDQQNTNFAVQMWQYLLAGQKVDDASYNAGTKFPLQIYQGPNTPPDNNHTTSPEIYGDGTMTLHNKVYGWVSGPTWYW